MKLIDKDALVAEIERKKIPFKKDIDDGVYPTYLCALMDFEDFLDTLEVKEVYVSNPQFPHLKDIIDKVFGAGNLESWEYDDAEQLVLLAKDEVISRACEAAGIKKPYKDGNQWCILKGENIQEGICGFGDNIEDALVDFLRNIPKIPLEVKEVEDKFEIPQNGIKDAIEVVSRMKHIDDGLKPIADFILGYASWNLHKDEWNQPTIEVPLFRVLDALIHRGKGYYCI